MHQKNHLMMDLELWDLAEHCAAQGDKLFLFHFWVQSY